LPVVSLCRLTLTSNFFIFCYTQTAQGKNLYTASLNSHWSWVTWCVLGKILSDQDGGDKHGWFGVSNRQHGICQFFWNSEDWFKVLKIYHKYCILKWYLTMIYYYVVFLIIYQKENIIFYTGMFILHSTCVYFYNLFYFI
jgi:hypothetical protein